MEVEIATLDVLNVWGVKENDPNTMPNVIWSTWAFKCNRYPDGFIKKFKARFCTRGDMQLEGIDFFEKYALDEDLVDVYFGNTSLRSLRLAV
jgi:hypothetical protein